MTPNILKEDFFKQQDLAKASVGGADLSTVHVERFRVSLFLACILASEAEGAQDGCPARALHHTRSPQWYLGWLCHMEAVKEHHPFSSWSHCLPLNFHPAGLIRNSTSALPGDFVRCRAKGHWLRGCGEHPPAIGQHCILVLRGYPGPSPHGSWLVGQESLVRLGTSRPFPFVLLSPPGLSGHL